MSPEGLRILIVGPGRVGLSLGYALAQTEALASLAYAGRQPDPPGHPLFVQGIARYTYGMIPPGPGTDAVFLAVPDDAVHDTAQQLAVMGSAPRECAAFHLSGAMSADILAPLHERGYSVGCMHPLQTLTNPVTGADLLQGAFFSISGEPRARATAQRILAALGSPWFQVPATRRPTYDAAVVMGSTYLGVLLEQTRDLLVEAGVPWDDAGPALRRLVLGALSNLESGEGQRVPSGPISRGDLETVRLHLRALDPPIRALYAAIGRLVLETDRMALDSVTARGMEDLFKEER